MRSRYGIVELDFEISKSIRYHAYRRSFWEGLALPWQFKGTFRGISVGYEFRIGKAKRRRYLWKRKNCQSSASGSAEAGNTPSATHEQAASAQSPCSLSASAAARTAWRPWRQRGCLACSHQVSQPLPRTEPPAPLLRPAHRAAP